MIKDKNSIDYKKLNLILGQVVAEVQQARLECDKTHPNTTVICDHAVENLGNLLDEITECVFVFHSSSNEPNSRDGSAIKETQNDYSFTNNGSLESTKLLKKYEIGWAKSKL